MRRYGNFRAERSKLRRCNNIIYAARSLVVEKDTLRKEHYARKLLSDVKKLVGSSREVCNMQTRVGEGKEKCVFELPAKAVRTSLYVGREGCVNKKLNNINSLNVFP